jgi:hypothetical protein
MAVVVVSDNNTRRESMEGAYSAVNIGAGAGGGTEGDFVYEGAQSWSRKVGATDARGMSITITSIDLTTAANRVMMAKMIVTNKDAINSNALNWYIGDAAPVGSAVTDAYRYIIADDGTILDAVGGDPLLVYPILGGWIVIPIDINVTAWRDALIGTAPTLTAITEVAVASGMGSTSRAENIAFDAIDLSEGLWLVGGTSTDPDGTWLDFIAWDEDEGGSGGVGDRIGHVQTREGVIYAFGQFTIGETDTGTDTDTVFQDSLRTIVFPGGRVAAGWNSVEVELAQANTDVDMNNISFVGRGRDDLKHFFDSSADQVDGTNNEIDITGHGYKTGDAVLYSVEGGTAISGLTDATEYFVRAETADAFSLYDERGQSFVGGATGKRVLTAAGTGQSHSFRRQPDTRPDFNARGTLGALDYNSCVFVNCRNFLGTSAVTFTGCTFVGCKNIDIVDGVITGCAVSDFLLAEGEAAVLTSDLENDIINTAFVRTAGVGQLGHAVEIDTAGTYAHTGNTYTGYGPDKASFHSQTGVDDVGEVITTDAAHGFVDGDAVYYGDEGGTPIGGLTDGNRYYVNSITATTLSLHVTRADAVADANRVNLTDGAVAETHYLYSGHAALLNSSGGLVTVNVSGGDSPSVRNTPGSTTVVNNPVTFTVSELVAGSEVGIYRTSDDVQLAFIESSSTSFPYNYTYGGDVNIYVIVQKLTHKWRRFNSVLEATSKSVPANQQPDPDYVNP